MRYSRSTFGALAMAVLFVACERAPEPERSEVVESRAAAEGSTSASSRANHERSGKTMKGFVGNIEAMTKGNQDFRRVVYTGRNIQLVLMSIPPGEHIGAEVHHDVDQFFRVEAGEGEVVIDDNRTPIGPETAIVVPAGAKHDVINRGNTPLQLYTLYAPPEHRDGVVHPTRADAERDTEEFDGRTTE